MPSSSPRATSPNVDDVLSSWVLDALRRVMGFEDMRNTILSYFLKNTEDVVLGRTFGMENTETEVVKYLKKITGKTLSNKKYLLFTASNQASQGETHYQAFVVDYVSKKLWVIDPASVEGKQGIYDAYVATLTIMPFFKKLGWKTGFVKLTNACQSTTDDIFCQTWSLWLLIKFINILLHDKPKTITISKSLFVRYRRLLRFYKECIDVPGVCEELRRTYQETIQTSEYLVQGEKTKKGKDKVVKYYLSYDPCAQVRAMNEMDLMTEAQRSMSPLYSV